MTAREYPDQMRLRLEEEHPDWTQAQVTRAMEREWLAYDIADAELVYDLKSVLTRILEMIP